MKNITSTSFLGHFKYLPLVKYFSMLIEIIAVLLDFKIKVLSFSSTNETCDYKCKDAEGEMPYLHQVRVDSLEYLETFASKEP